MGIATGTALTPPTNRERCPWGEWQVLDSGRGYKVKRLTVDPYSRLSLQSHVHRAEHWLVVCGIATCTVADQSRSVSPGGHVFVPQGLVHRIGNDSPDELVVVEIQLGAYCGEDDILRLHDDYGRV